MHTIMNKKFYLGLKFGTLFNKTWVTISELLQLDTKLRLRRHHVNTIVIIY
jgi:hypothetical protein